MEIHIPHTTNIRLLETDQEREELRRSYFLNEISEQHKSEFIDGQIVIHSPAKAKHIDVNIALTILLKLYVEENKLGYLATEKALVEMAEVKNNYEPDICFFDSRKAKKINRDTCIFPPPDLAVEILSKSSKDRDRNKKFKDYAVHDVEEYWIIDTDKYQIEQYYLKKTGEYKLLKIYNLDDEIESAVVRKFKIPVDTIFFYDKLNDYLFGEYKKDISQIKQELQEKEQIIQEKEQIIQENKQIIQENKQKLQENKQKLQEKEQKLQENKQKLQEKEQIIQESKQELQEKEQIIKKQAEFIKQFKKQLKK